MVMIFDSVTLSSANPADEAVESSNMILEKRRLRIILSA